MDVGPPPHRTIANREVITLVQISVFKTEVDISTPMESKKLRIGTNELSQQSTLTRESIHQERATTEAKEERAKAKASGAKAKESEV